MLDKTVWRQDMINNPLGMKVNLRVFKVVRILLEFGHATNQLKNLKDKGRQQKKKC